MASPPAARRSDPSTRETGHLRRSGYRGIPDRRGSGGAGRRVLLGRCKPPAGPDPATKPSSGPAGGDVWGGLSCPYMHAKKVVWKRSFHLRMTNL